MPKTLEEIIYQARWVDGIKKDPALVSDAALAKAIEEAGYVLASETLDEAAELLNKEAVGFQRGWGSTPEDVARLDGIGKCMDWLKEKATKARG
jgi:hypothetical protein